MSEAYRSLSLSWDELRTATLNLSNEWLAFPERTDHRALGWFKDTLDDFERLWNRENGDWQVKMVWKKAADEAAQLRKTWEKLLTLIGKNELDNAQDAVKYKPRRWDPCDDAIERIAEAIARVLEHCVVGMPERLERPTARLSHEMAQIIFKPTLPIHQWAKSPRLLVLRNWLQFHGFGDDAKEVKERLESFLSKLREWEQRARDMVDYTWSACQDIRRGGGVPSAVDLFGEDLCGEHEELMDVLVETQGYLKQLSMMLRSKIRERIEQREAVPPYSESIGRQIGSSGQDRPPEVETHSQKPKTPPDDYLKIYRVYWSYKGTKNQTEVAQIVTKHGIVCDQPKVARALARVQQWLNAGNVLPEIASTNVNPTRVHMPAEVMELGPRTNRRSKRQRPQSDSISD